MFQLMEMIHHSSGFYKINKSVKINVYSTLSYLILNAVLMIER